MDKNIVMQWKTRKNGWGRPWNGLQIISWIIFLLNIFYFWAFVVTMNNWVIATVIGIIYLLVSFLIMKYAISAMLCDPIDPIILKERKWRADNVSFCKSEFEFFCSICDTHVTDQAKHWGKCNKCISGFDHHWYWLNTWIGEKNYKIFFKLLIVLILQNLIFMSSISVNLIFNDKWEEKVIKVVKIKTHITLLILNIVMGLINLAEWLITGKLMLFHIYLKCKGVSTFEYIKRNMNYKSRFKIRRDSFQGRSSNLEPSQREISEDDN